MIKESTNESFQKTRFGHRLIRMGVWLLLGGTVLTGVLVGVFYAISFLAGGMVAWLSLSWLRQAVNSAFSRNPAASKLRLVGGFILRLMLIPLCLYVMIRFLFLSVFAVVAGFVVFNCCLFVEGVLEAFSIRSKS